MSLFALATFAFGFFFGRARTCRPHGGRPDGSSPGVQEHEDEGADDEHLQRLPVLAQGSQAWHQELTGQHDETGHHGDREAVAGEAKLDSCRGKGTQKGGRERGANKLLFYFRKCEWHLQHRYTANCKSISGHQGELLSSFSHPVTFSLVTCSCCLQVTMSVTCIQILIANQACMS